MNAKDAIKNSMQMSHMVLTTYLSDLNDADLLVRPVAGANHIAWQVGHLICSEQQMIDGVRPGSCPALPAGFAENHAVDRSKSDGPDGFLKKQQYLDVFEKQRAATIRALDALPEADLDKEGPERMRELCPTVGSVFALLGLHELMHAGQFAVLRRKLGKPVLI